MKETQTRLDRGYKWNTDWDEDYVLDLNENIHLSSSENEDSSSSCSEIFSEDDEDASDESESCRDWVEEREPAEALPQFPFTASSESPRTPTGGTPLDFFNLYFADDLVDIIVGETNRYASQRRGSSWIDTSRNEIRIFLALTMLQDLVAKPSLWLYWTKKAMMDTPFFRQCMSFHRFKLLRRYLQFASNDDYDPKEHPNLKLYQINPVYKLLSDKFKSLYTLDTDVMIDESFMLYKGRLGWVQYLPLKRVCFGIKLYLLCESKSGYVWSTIIYTGKDTQLNPSYKDLPVPSQVVLSLMEPLLGKGHCLVTHSSFTSPKLAELLIEHHTDMYGTVRQTRKELPPQVRTKELKRGEGIAFRCGKILVMKWKDKREASFLSTVHSSKMIERERKEGRIVQVPQIVKDYNNTVGGVGFVDHSFESFPVVRKRGKKTYHKLFFHLLELAVWNSFILFKKTGRNKKPLDYRLELIERMVAKYRDPSAKVKERPSKTATPLRLSVRHFPDVIPATEKKTAPTRVCAVCARKKNPHGKKIRRESRYYCKDCNVGLCVAPCFRDFHSKHDLS